MLLRRLGKLGVAGAAAAIFALVFHPTGAEAQYPDKPIRLVVGYAPGGPADILARIVAPALGKHLGQPIVVENRAGANGTIAVGSVVKSPADGYTVLLATETDMAIVPNLMRLPYDTAKDLKQVVAVGEQFVVLVVRPESGIGSLREFLARAKASPGSITYASAGKGTPAHMAAALLAVTTGVEMRHIPYKGAGPASAGLLGGHVDTMFLGGPTAISHVGSGKLKALAVSGAKRASQLPGVPTFAEAGAKVSDLEKGFWMSLTAPAGLPSAIADRLSQAWLAAVAERDTTVRLEQQGLLPHSEDGKTVGGWVERDLEKWARVIKASGITPD